MESTPDLNADLTGQALRVEMPHVGLVDATVLGSASWSSMYVELETEHGRTVRLASLVRRGRELS